MRSIALLMCLAASIASAQQTDAPTVASETLSPPPLPNTEPPPPPAPSATGPAEPASERAIRYSRYSAGSGGMLFAFTELITGFVGGAIVGDTYKRDSAPDEEKNDNAYAGAVIGGLSLGTLGIIYQYLVPIEPNESLLLVEASTTSFLAAFGIANGRDMSRRDRAWLGLAATQVGVISTLALTSGGGDVSDGDAALVGMTSFYAFTITGLLQLIQNEASDEDIDSAPTLVAPAVGMALGALLTGPLELESSRIFKLTLLPLGVGLSLYGLGAALTDGTTVPLTALAGVAASFALTLLLTSDPGVPTLRDGPRRADIQAIPVPVVMAAGRDNEALAAGPGVLLRF